MIDYSKLIKALKDGTGERTMNELIDKLRGCGQCNDDSCKYLDEDDWYCDKDAIMRDAADALKAADKRIAELEAQMPKQGKWISDLPNELFVNVNPWKCSVCGKHQHFREDYCPNCGAKMDGETEYANTYSLGKIEMPKGAIEQIIADGERKDGEG